MQRYAQQVVMLSSLPACFTPSCIEKRIYALMAVYLHAGYSTGITLTARAGAASHSQEVGAHRASTRSPVHLYGMCSTPEESSRLHPLWAYLLLWLPHEGQSERGTCLPRVQQSACQWLR